MEEKTNKSKNNKKSYISSVGRRREAIARVRLYPTYNESLSWGEISLKKGDILVNQKPVEEYFSGAADKAAYREPLRVTNTLNRYTFTIKVTGGGKAGQLDAVINGLARALQKADEKFRPILKKKGYLTRDARVRERRKVGTGGKARREKQSPKR